MLIKVKNFSYLLLLLCLAGAFTVDTIGQDKKAPKPPKTEDVGPVPGAGSPRHFDDDGVTSERSMVVDANVAIKLCVAEGDLKINGWHRNEVRVFVKSGRKFRMKPLEKSVSTGKVNWLWVGNIVEGRPGPAAECLAGDTIEIDAPVGANFDLSARSARTAIDSVKKVKVKNTVGMITLRNVTGGITAYTGQGDVIVENSAGAIDLESTTGNIVAVEVNPGQIGDLLRARTNSGAISFQKVNHRQIQASSVSGTLVFDGKFMPGGIYNFRTSNGSIRISIPLASSCIFTTTYGDGVFKSEIPLKVLTEDITPRAKIVVSKIGNGDAAVTLTTSNGSIGIRRSPAAAKP